MSWMPLASLAQGTAGTYTGQSTSDLTVTAIGSIQNSGGNATSLSATVVLGTRTINGNTNWSVGEEIPDEFSSTVTFAPDTFNGDYTSPFWAGHVPQPGTFYLSEGESLAGLLTGSIGLGQVPGAVTIQVPLSLTLAQLGYLSNSVIGGLLPIDDPMQDSMSLNHAYNLAGRSRCVTKRVFSGEVHRAWFNGCLTNTSPCHFLCRNRMTLWAILL